MTIFCRGGVGGYMGGELSKNGHDQHQDRELRENREAHRDIGRSVAGIRRMLWGLLLAGIAGLIGILSYITAQVDGIRDDVDQLEERVIENTAHFREFQGIGIKWGEDLDRSDAVIQEDLRRLRRLVNEHQRNKQEHAH